MWPTRQTESRSFENVPSGQSKNSGRSSQVEVRRIFPLHAISSSFRNSKTPGDRLNTSSFPAMCAFHFILHTSTPHPQPLASRGLHSASDPPSETIHSFNFHHEPIPLSMKDSSTDAPWLPEFLDDSRDTDGPSILTLGTAFRWCFRFPGLGRSRSFLLWQPRDLNREKPQSNLGLNDWIAALRNHS